jgi:hypothetical protein
MKAVVSEAFGGPEVLHLRELPDPPPPGPSEAQVKFVHSSSPGLARAGLAFHMSEVAREADIRGHDKSDANDAVDGAHSSASECHRVAALKQTTMRGAVHGRG